MPSEVIPFLQLFSVGLAVEARINDIPVASALGTQQQTVHRPVREFLLPGRNDLTFQAVAAGSRFEAGQQLKLRVAEFEETDMLTFEGGREFAAFQPQLSEQTASPLQQGVTFEHPGLGRTWAWAQASTINIQTQRALLDTYIHQLYTAFAARDIDRLMKEVQLRMEESTFAYPALPLAARESGFEHMITGSAVWRPRPFDPSAIVYRSVAHGRLVEVLDSQGFPFVRTEATSYENRYDDPDYSELQMLIGYYQGRCRILN